MTDSDERASLLPRRKSITAVKSFIKWTSELFLRRRLAFPELKVDAKKINVKPGNTKLGSITVPLTSCLTGLESVV